MKRIFLIFLLLNCLNVKAQEQHNEHNHLGISVGISKIFPEKTYVPGGHFHYSYLFKIKNIQLGVGTSLEYLFDKHQHIGTDLSFSIFPTEDIEISIAPGLVFSNNIMEYATHFELGYSFDLHSVHLGPIIEMAVSKEDIHLTIGVHVGFGF